MRRCLVQGGGGDLPDAYLCGGYGPGVQGVGRQRLVHASGGKAARVRRIAHPAGVSFRGRRRFARRVSARRLRPRCARRRPATPRARLGRQGGAGPPHRAPRRRRWFAGRVAARRSQARQAGRRRAMPRTPAPGSGAAVVCRARICAAATAPVCKAVAGNAPHAGAWFRGRRRWFARRVVARRLRPRCARQWPATPRARLGRQGGAGPPHRAPPRRRSIACPASAP